jgi:hypothetical protein
MVNTKRAIDLGKEKHQDQNVINIGCRKSSDRRNNNL